MKSTNEVSIEITRHDNKLSAVSIIMPTWNELGNDNKIYAKMPFLGIETYGKDEDDLQIAIKEALTCFCIIAEKHGLGLEHELEFLGWVKEDNPTNDHSILRNVPANKSIDSVLSTGDTRALMVDLSPSTLVCA